MLALYERTLSHSIRRLARTYREAATWQQLAVLAVLLLIYSLTQTTWVLAGTAIVLGILFSLRLDLGLLLIVFAIPFAFTYKQIGTDIVSLPEMLTLVCFIAWGALHVRTFKRPNVLTFQRWNALDWGVLFFVAVAFASLLVAEDIDTARWELRILVIEPALLYLMVRSGRNRAPAAGQDRPEINLRATTQRPLKGAGPPQAAQTENESVLRLTDALIAGAVVVSVVGLYQYFFTDYVEAVEGVRRILSLYDSPNHLSLYLGRVIPISLCLAAFGTTRRGRVTRWRRLAHGLALIPLTLCLYLTYSRGAWLLGLPAALLFIGLMRGRWGKILALGGLAAALLALVPVLRTPRIATLLTLQSGTNFLRLVLWEGTARMIAANPVFGVGLGNFMRHYPRYMLPEGGHERVVFHPHNLLLDTWTSLGIPGLAALAWIQIAFFRLGVRLYRRLTTEPELQALTLGLMASMVSFLAHGLVDTGFRLTDLAFVFMLTLGIVRRIGADFD